MKKTIARMFVLFSVTALLFSACNDDAPYYGIGIESEYNSYYSNRLNKDHVTYDLELNFSGEELVGKEVHFQLMTKSTAQIKFFNIIQASGEIVFEDHALTKKGDGYSFSGSHTTKEEISFSYSGEIVKNENGKPVMKLNITNVSIPANTLTEEGSLKTVAYRDETNGSTQYLDESAFFEWTFINEDGDEENVLGNNTEIVGNILSNIVYLTVDQLNFHQDGNVTSVFQRLPEGVTLETLRREGYYTSDDRLPSETSPINLINFTKSGSNYLFKADVSTIINLVLTNKAAATRLDIGDLLGGGDLNIMEIIGMVNKILNLIPEMNRWTTDGIALKLEEVEKIVGVDPSLTVYHAMDYLLYVDGDELMPFLKVLPDILSILDIEIGSIDLNAIMENVKKTNSIKAGIYLQKI